MTLVVATYAEQIALGDLMPGRGESVDPSRHPDEMFELYSIPAFDSGEAELTTGSEIGSAKQAVQPGDVLLSRIVPHIRRAWIVGRANRHRQIASGEWIVFRSRRIEPRYLRHLLVSNDFHTQFMNTVAGVGGSLLRARPSYVAGIQIALPPLPEQRRIAEILDKVDALRAKRRAALVQLDILTQSIFLDMFGDPATNPKRWHEATLGEVAGLVTGFPFQSERYVGAVAGIRLCRGANVLPGRIDWNDLACWPANDAGRYAAFQLEAGDVVLAMDRPWISQGFKIAQVQSGDTPALLVQRVARIRRHNATSNDFLFHLLRHPYFARRCRPTETTIPHISPNDLKSFVFPCPPVSLQRQFEERIAKWKRIIADQQSAMTLLDTLFASLQQRAFRGEF